jgi:hypothetical protein
MQRTSFPSTQLLHLWKPLFSFFLQKSASLPFSFEGMDQLKEEMISVLCRICSFCNLQNMKVVGLPATSRTRCAKFGGIQNHCCCNDELQCCITGHLPWQLNEICLMSWYLATIM